MNLLGLLHRAMELGDHGPRSVRGLQENQLANTTVAILDEALSIVEELITEETSSCPSEDDSLSHQQQDSKQ